MNKLYGLVIALALGITILLVGLNGINEVDNRYDETIEYKHLNSSFKVNNTIDYSETQNPNFIESIASINQTDNQYYHSFECNNNIIENVSIQYQNDNSSSYLRFKLFNSESNITDLIPNELIYTSELYGLNIGNYLWLQIELNLDISNEITQNNTFFITFEKNNTMSSTFLYLNLDSGTYLEDGDFTPLYKTIVNSDNQLVWQNLTTYFEKNLIKFNESTDITGYDINMIISSNNQIFGIDIIETNEESNFYNLNINHANNLTRLSTSASIKHFTTFNATEFKYLYNISVPLTFTAIVHPEVYTEIWSSYLNGTDIKPYQKISETKLGYATTTSLEWINVTYNLALFNKTTYQNMFFVCCYDSGNYADWSCESIITSVSNMSSIKYSSSQFNKLLGAGNFPQYLIANVSFYNAEIDNSNNNSFPIDENLQDFKIYRTFSNFTSEQNVSVMLNDTDLEYPFRSISFDYNTTSNFTIYINSTSESELNYTLRLRILADVESFSSMSDIGVAIFTPLVVMSVIMGVLYTYIKKRGSKI